MADQATAIGGARRAAPAATRVRASLLWAAIVAGWAMTAAIAPAAAMTDDRPAASRPRAPAAAANGPMGGVWQSLSGGDLSAAAMGVVALSGPRPKRGSDCRQPGRCQPSEPRVTLALDRAPPLGPIGGRGFAVFTSAAGQRIYAFPQPAKGDRRTWEDDWAWGIGARIDAMRLVAAERSSEAVFALVDLGLGLADEPVDATDYRLRARLLVGTSGGGALICGFGELGAGIKDPGRPGSGAVFGRAGVEIRF